LVAGIGTKTRKAKDAELNKGHISRDPIRIFVSAPPPISVSDLLKGPKEAKLVADADGL